MLRCLFSVCLLALSTLPGFAQTVEEIMPWHASAVPSEVSAGKSTQVKLEAKIKSGWHSYSITQAPGGPTRMLIGIAPGQPFSIEGKIDAPKPQTSYDANFEMQTETYTGELHFGLPVKVAANAQPGKQQIPIDIQFQVCNESTCLPPKKLHLLVPVTVVAAKAEAVPPASSVEPKTPAATNSPSSPDPNSIATPAASGAQGGKAVNAAPVNGHGDVEQRSMASFLWLAMGMGALSLLTPCVFPMIPITVSYFTSHAATRRSAAIRDAFLYSLGIVLTFTLLGLTLALLFGAGGVNQLAANPWVNLLITAIFLGFALSLFGAYFLQVPSGMVAKIDSFSRGKETGKIAGTLAMGLTFSLTSFTCTAPFVGTLLVMASQGNWKWPFAGMLAFSSVFALPFFVLALAPQLLSNLPKSGNWLNSVKIVMGFLEIAAAMKFLSNADLIWHWGIFNRTGVLAIWVAIGLIATYYLLGRFQLGHESAEQSVSGFRVVLAIVFLSVTVWLSTGFLGRSMGELESFLPPQQGGTAELAGNSSSDLSWIENNYRSALDQAKTSGKPVFIDFTGYTCTNCRWMEANMFPRPEVKQKLGNFVRVRLYTDGDGRVYSEQQSLEKTQFGTIALPLYAIVDTSGKTVATYSGLTRNEQEFLHFLSAAQAL